MYLSWNKKTIENFKELSRHYDEGYVLTRENKGSMDQTRSVRIDLDAFELSSENRRILRKTEGLIMGDFPIPYSEYTWQIGKLGKDFYEEKFDEVKFSANKIKELITDKEKSNFNLLLKYEVTEQMIEEINCHCAHSEPNDESGHLSLGYVICYENEEIMHYSYPFYNLEYPNRNIGMGMMLNAILYAKEKGKKYFYLGSAQRPTDKYKLQFKGLEWFDGEKWNKDLDELKEILANL